MSFMLELIFNLVAGFQANLALLILQADYSRRRQSTIRLLSLPVEGGRRKADSLRPSRLRRSLARSRETRFTRPNRRACSQARRRKAEGWISL